MQLVCTSVPPPCVGISTVQSLFNLTQSTEESVSLIKVRVQNLQALSQFICITPVPCSEGVGDIVWFVLISKSFIPFSLSAVKRMGRTRRKRSGTTAPRRSWSSSWSVWIKSTGRWTCMSLWRRWRRKSMLTWTSPRTSLTKHVETIKPTSLLSMVKMWFLSSHPNLVCDLTIEPGHATPAVYQICSWNGPSDNMYVLPSGSSAPLGWQLGSQMWGAAFSSCFTLCHTTSNCFPLCLPPRRQSG